MTFFKKIFNYKVLSVVFLLSSLIGTVYLVRINQENRSKATPGWANSPEKKAEDAAAAERQANRAAQEQQAESNVSLYDEKRAAEEAAKAAEQATEQAAANIKLTEKYKTIDDCLKEKGSKTCQEAFNPQANDYTEVDASSSSQCSQNGGAWCGGCGGFCISLGQSNVGCNVAALEKCGEAIVYGANFIVPTNGQCTGAYYMSCPCGGKTVCFDRGITVKQGSSVGNQCEGTQGLCAVYNQSKDDKSGGIYLCKDVTSGAPEGLRCDETTGGVPITSIPACFCGTIQVDTAGGGYKSYTSNCGCKTTKNRPDSIVSNSLTVPTSIPTYIPTNTPTPTGTLVPTNTPTTTPTPTGVWSSPTPTPTSVVATSSPTRYITSGPSPTRIVLPNAGVNFPIQALTVVGVITTLLGFLILL